MIVEPVVKNLFKTIGEGPYWDARYKQILAADAKAQTLDRWNTETGILESVKVPGKFPAFA